MSSVALGVLLRVDAGLTIGLGHLQRSLSLAAAFVAEGCRVAFLVNDDALVTARVTSASWIPARLSDARSWSADDAEQTIREARCRECVVVVMDTDGESTNYVSRLQNAGLFVCVVNDSGAERVIAQVLLNGNAHACTVRYGHTKPDTLFLLGPEFAPLASPYWIASAPHVHLPPREVLITLGGSDPLHLMPTLLSEALRLPSELHLNVIIGPFTRNRTEIATIADRQNGRVTLYEAPDNMAALIAGSDIAITGGGQTLYELAALGRPAVAIQIAKNQLPQLDAFVQCGAVVRAGKATDPGIATFAVTQLNNLCADTDRLGAMAAAGPSLVDGRGARRAVAAILARARGELTAIKERGHA